MEKLVQIQKVNFSDDYIIKLSGTLNEALEENAFAELNAKTVLFDLEKLKRVTSFGVGRWLSSIKSLKALDYAFWGCQPAVISQFNMIDSFGGTGQILSLYAPHICINCEREIHLFLNVIESYSIILSGQLPIIHCPTCKKEAFFDDLPNIYFSCVLTRAIPSMSPAMRELVATLHKNPAKATEPIRLLAPLNPTPLPNSLPVRRTLITQNNNHSLNFRSKKYSLLLVDGDPVQLKKMSLLLSSLVSVDVAPNPKMVSPNNNTHDLLVVNADTLSEREREILAGDFAGAEMQKKLVFFSGEPDRSYLSQFLARFGLMNFLARNSEVDPEELYITVHKLLSRDIFGIEKYFSWGARSFSKSFRSSSEKKELLELAGQFANEAGLQSRFADMFVMVTEELTTNALYDAPVDKAGKYRYAHYSRNQEVILEPGEEILVTFCCDGRRIGVSVSDSFGSLTPEKILHYLAKCFQKNENQVDKKQGGAGLGLYYTYESVSHLIVNEHPGFRTEVVGLLDLRGSYKDFVQKNKSLNIFVKR